MRETASQQIISTHVKDKCNQCKEETPGAARVYVFRSDPVKEFGANFTGMEALQGKVHFVFYPLSYLFT